MLDGARRAIPEHLKFRTLCRTVFEVEFYTGHSARPPPEAGMTREKDASTGRKVPSSDSAKVKEHIRKLLTKAREKTSKAAKRSALYEHIARHLAGSAKVALVLASVA
jgi:hypothetical protein